MIDEAQMVGVMMGGVRVREQERGWVMMVVV